MRDVALSLGPLTIRWYGLLWVAAFALAWYVLPRLAKYRQIKLTRDDWWLVLAAGLTGAVIGGRLGYVLLWEPRYFLAHPSEILSIWNGGMSSHGGFMGVGLALWWVTTKLKINFWALLDVIVIPAALGLALGRAGNFLNQELFNPPELALLAAAKDILIAGVCFTYLRFHPSVSPEQRRGEGAVLALFLTLYGLLRFLVEFVRVQEFSGAFGLTRGQLLTLPLIAAGGLMWIWLRDSERRKKV